MLHQTDIVLVGRVKIVLRILALVLQVQDLKVLQVQVCVESFYLFLQASRKNTLNWWRIINPIYPYTTSSWFSLTTVFKEALFCSFFNASCSSSSKKSSSIPKPSMLSSASFFSFESHVELLSFKNTGWMSFSVSKLLQSGQSLDLKNIALFTVLLSIANL